MKYRAPQGVTALSCAGQAISLDKDLVFEAVAELAEELAAHGCVTLTDEAAVVAAVEGKPRRARAEKVS